MVSAIEIISMDSVGVWGDIRRGLSARSPTSNLFGSSGPAAAASQRSFLQFYKEHHFQYTNSFLFLTRPINCCFKSSINVWLYIVYKGIVLLNCNRNAKLC